MPGTKLSDDARQRIETHADRTGAEPPPIPTFTMSDRMVSDAVRQRIEAAETGPQK